VCKVLCRSEIKKVLVVGENDDRVRVPLKIVAPRLQSTDNGKEFPIIDLVISFSRVE
jgi:hypothetical protein